MSKAWQKHRDRRISEHHKGLHNSNVNKKVEMKTFGQRVKKAWKNIIEKKSN
jgi:hypothetical protein